MQSYNPHGARSTSLGSFLFARHYSGNHYYFLFHRVLRCFSSPGWLPAFGGILYLQYSGLSHSEIYGYNARVQLSAAYRSLPRPSSPLRPKASTIRPYVALKKFEIVVAGCVLPHRPLICYLCKFIIRFPNMSKSLIILYCYKRYVDV
jgi:hypothetical protein